MGHVVWLLVLAVVLITGTSGDDSPTIVFTAGESSYQCYRIPALVYLASTNTLLAFSEARKYSCSDDGYIDLVLKRSLDLGVTWGPVELVRSESTAASNVTVGNPAPVPVPYAAGDYGSTTAGEAVALPYCVDNERAFVMLSSDGGESWGPPEELPLAGSWGGGWVATGPPGSLALQSGQLLVPGDHSRGAAGAQIDSHVWVGYPGKGWAVGGTVDGGNECQAAQVPDGTVLLSMRSSSSLYKERLFATSYDEGQTFTAAKGASPALPDPNCEGSTISAGSDSELLLLSNPSSSTSRKNLMVHYSSNNGTTWEPLVTLWAGNAAYSSLAMLSSSTAACLFEPLDYSPDYTYGSIAYVTFNYQTSTRK